MSNVRAGCMVGAMKGSLRQRARVSAEAWEDLLPWTVYGYHRRRMRQGLSNPFELLYGVTPKMTLEEGVSVRGDSQDDHCKVTFLSVVGCGISHIRRPSET